MKRIKELFGLIDNECLFYIGFSLFFFTCWMSQTSFNYNKMPLMVLAAIVLFYKNIRTKFTAREYVIGLTIFGVAACSYISTGSYAAVWCAAIVVSMKDVSIKKVLKIMLFISMTITAVVILLSLLGVAGEVSRVYFGRAVDSEIRYHLGVKHPNNLHFRYLFMLALLCGLCFERIKLYHYAILFAVNAGLGMLTLSRTGFLTCTLLIMSMMALRYFPKYVTTRNAYILVNIGCAVLIVLSLVGIAGFDGESPIWAKLDKVTSGRLDLGNQCLATYGLSLFGNKVDGYIFDMGIPRVLIEEGLLYFSIVYIGMFFVIRYFYQKQQYKYIIMIVVFLIYSMSERMNTYAYYNVQIVLMGYAMWKILDQRKKEELL